MPHNLPLRLTSFVGREREIAEVAALVGARRLVTLVGAPGVGKTRLSLEIAAASLDTFADGAWLVELAPLTDPVLVPQAVATVLGVREQPGRSIADSIADFLRARQLLLVLDNCEHLIGAVAALAERLLRESPQLQILATSREPLAVEGEVTWRVPSLTLPDRAAALGDAEAIRLFVERARDAAPSFTLGERNAPAVIQICAHLDGIPLALELAAARVRALSVEQIAARLDDRFHLLTGGSRTVLPRQQTLRGAVDWSYDLLSEPEQALLRRLAVFAGGFTLGAAEAVASGEWRVTSEAEDHSPLGTRYSVLDLVDKSLVQVDEAEDAERRYRLLETLREYGLEKLAEHGELAETRDRHRDYFLMFAESIQANLIGQGEVVTLERIEPELDNLRAALAWCLERDRVSPGVDIGVRIAGAIWRLWWRLGRFDEGRRWFDEVLKLPAGDETPAGLSARARARFGAAQLACYRGAFRVGIEQMEEALALSRQAGDESGVVTALQRIGFYLAHLGDFDLADRLCEESIALGRQIGDPFALAGALRTAGIVTEVLGQFERSVLLCEESLALCRQFEHHAGTVFSLGALARAVAALGDLTRATALHEESLKLARKIGDERSIAEITKDRGRTALLGGDPDRVVEMLRLAIPVYGGLGDYLGTSLCILDLAGARTLLGAAHDLTAVPSGPADADGRSACFLEAARLYAAASTLREAYGIILHPHRRAPHDRDLAILRESLGEEVFRAAWADGRAMSLEQVADYAMTITAPTEPPAGAPLAHTVEAAAPAERSASEHDAEIARLSGREREVAALVTRGLTNRQIGARLHLSERTVDTHVRNILGKLELTSRAQIAAWTVEHGLGTPRPT